jgi:hypothetical protein
MELQATAGAASAGARTVTVDPSDVQPAVGGVPQAAAAEKNEEETLGVGTIFGHQTDDKRIGNNLGFLDDTQSKSADTLPVAEKAPFVQSEATGVRRKSLRRPSLESGMNETELPPPPKATPKLGTLMGVFVPCTQNILGAILYLRLSWIVGQAGVGMVRAHAGPYARERDWRMACRRRALW